MLMVHDVSEDKQAKTRTAVATDGDTLSAETEERVHILHVERAATIQPMSGTTVFGSKTASGIIQGDLYTTFGPDYLCKAGRKTMDIFPGRHFCTLNAKASILALSLAKHQRVTLTCPPPPEIIHHKFDEPSSYQLLYLLPDSANVVHVKPASDYFRQMRQHATVHRNGKHHLKTDRRQKITTTDR